MIILIQALQMMLHLPMLQIKVPGLVLMVFEIVIPIAMFDILENDFGFDTGLIFEYDDVGQGNLNSFLYDQLQSLGYSTHNLLGNLNTLGIIFFFYWTQIMCFIILWSFLKISKKLSNYEFPKLQKHIDKQIENLFFSALINIMMEGYLEFLITSNLSLQYSLKTTNGEIFATYLTYPLIGLALGVMPLVFIWSLNKTRE